MVKIVDVVLIVFRGATVVVDSTLWLRGASCCDGETRIEGWTSELDLQSDSRLGAALAQLAELSLETRWQQATLVRWFAKGKRNQGAGGETRFRRLFYVDVRVKLGSFRRSGVGGGGSVWATDGEWVAKSGAKGIGLICTGRESGKWKSVVVGGAKQRSVSQIYQSRQQEMAASGAAASDGWPKCQQAAPASGWLAGSGTGEGAQVGKRLSSGCGAQRKGSKAAQVLEPALLDCPAGGLGRPMATTNSSSSC